MRTSRVLEASLATLTSLLPTACGEGADDGDGPADHRAEVPEAPAPTDGVQFVMPDTVIPAGTERMTCWIPDWVPDHDYFVTGFEGIQSPLGHHTVALASRVPRQAGEVFDCTSLEQMTTLEPLILPDPKPAGHAGHESGEAMRLLPEGFAVRMPAQAKIVIQSHYVNVEPHDIVVADVARLSFAAADAEITEVGYLILNHNTISVPPGPSEATVTCELERDLDLLLTLGHMHEQGRRFQLDLTRDGTTSMMYEVPQWSVEYRDRPPVDLYGATEPRRLLTGDRLDARCEYENPTDRAINFPSEMCTSVSYFFPAAGDRLIICETE